MWKVNDECRQVELSVICVAVEIIRKQMYNNHKES